MNQLKNGNRGKENRGRPTRNLRIARRISESERIEIEKRVSDILSNSGRAVAIVGSRLEILGANREFVQLLGYRTEELIGKTTIEITSPEDRLKTQVCERDLWSGRVPMFELEKSYLLSNGSPLRAYLRSFIISNDLGEPVCEMKVIEPLNRTLNLVDRLFDRVVSSFSFPELMNGLPVH